MTIAFARCCANLHGNGKQPTLCGAFLPFLSGPNDRFFPQLLSIWRILLHLSFAPNDNLHVGLFFFRLRTTRSR